jgi:putative nucleotidyltransferase with HDIG domain
MTSLTLGFEQAVTDARRHEQTGDWERALAAYRHALELAGDGSVRAELARKVGNIHYGRGDYESALPAYAISEHVAASAGARLEQAKAINCAANTALAQGDLERAEAEYRRALPLAQAAGADTLLTQLDQNLGILANIRGDGDTALALYGSVIDRYAQANNAAGLSGALNNAALIHADLQHAAEAEDCYNRALPLAEAAGDADLVGTILVNRAELLVRQNRLDEARMACDQAFGLFGRVESRSGLSEVCKVYGMMYRETGRVDLAESHLNIATRAAEESGYYLLNAQATAELALVHLARGSNHDALANLNRAHRLFEGIKARRELVNVERQLDRLEGHYLHVTEAWGESIEAKDHYTAGHCGRVADYTHMLAEAVGYEGRELTWIKMGGFLHDVGKTGVDAAILNKPGKLTPEEWELMQRHTVIGDEIISGLDFPYDIRPIVRNHHERWDGSGYPDRLMGDDIPRTARILCVADVFDSLTTTRSYRKAYTTEEALRIMHEESGSVLDPELFNIFIRRLEEEK